MIHVGHSSIPVVTGSGSFDLIQVAMAVLISTLLYKCITQKEDSTINHKQ